MKIAIIPVTDKGRILAEKIKGGLTEYNSILVGIKENVFNEFDALIYVCAIGIAVRKIAPFIKSKLNDPAVVVCDENGKWTVSLLSGHIGGANELATKIALITGATAVITTASDTSEFLREPQNIIVGIGCRKGISAEDIERAVTTVLYNNEISVYRICKLASIDIKKNEEGLLKFAELYKLPTSFYSAQELKNVKGEFTSSNFVKDIAGTDNVCERAAVLCGKSGKLIIKKVARYGVTVAAFEQNSCCEAK